MRKNSWESREAKKARCGRHSIRGENCTQNSRGLQRLPFEFSAGYSSLHHMRKIPEAGRMNHPKGLEEIVVIAHTWTRIVCVPKSQSGKPHILEDVSRMLRRVLPQQWVRFNPRLPLEFLTVSFVHDKPPAISLLQFRFLYSSSSSNKGFCSSKL